MRKKIIGLILLVAVVLLTNSIISGKQDTFEGTVPMPDFPEELEWVNADQPLTVADLEGKIVLMDFWTYGCINCIHMIPVLERLEEEYAEELVVIGVHSAKFENEGTTENIQQIVERYDVHHPVVNDKNFIIWQTYGIRAWPSFALIDPAGNVLAIDAGEIPYEVFQQFLDGMIEYWDDKDGINREPLEFTSDNAATPSSLLSFPGKILVDEADERLFIADSSNHRIIVADLNTYEVLDVIGNGARALVDGSYDDASFNSPQGMALRDNVLYIADVNNHAIRTVDLEAKDVSLLAGTGTMGRGGMNYGASIREPLIASLRSPWDVEFGDGDTLYIAMAGTHQIWEMNLETRMLHVAVGNGREAMLNDTLGTSELAQPSGLYFIGDSLYFADSESSTIRVANFANNTVATVSGTTDNSLFDFDDIDGELGISRLQHALGVDGDGMGTLYIADTYNSRIKIVDSDLTTTTLTGLGGMGGYLDGNLAEAEFDEPGGLDYTDGRLFVADTNNHAIRIIDLEADTVETLVFPNPEALQIEERVTLIGGNQAQDERVVLNDLTLATGDGEIVITLTLEDGYKLNDLIDSSVTWSVEGEAIALDDTTTSIDDTEVSIPVEFTEGDGNLHGSFTIYFCEAVNESLCFIDEFEVEAAVTVSAEGNSQLLIERALIPPQLNGFGGLN